MASFIQSASTVSSSPSAAPQSLAFASDVTAGNLIVAISGTLAMGGDFPSSTMTDTQGNHYTLRNSASQDSANVGIWTAVAGSSGPLTITCTLNFGNAHDLAIAEYSGQDSPYNNQGIGFRFSAAPAVTVVAPNATIADTNGAIIIYGCYNEGNSPASGWSPSPANINVRETTANTDGESLMLGDRFVLANGSYPGATLTVTSTINGLLAVMIAVGLPGAPTPGTASYSFHFASGSSGGGGPTIPIPSFVAAVIINGAKISIPAGSDLAHFPNKFLGTYAQLASVANGGVVQSATGLDIWFASDQFGKNVLPFERTAWFDTTGAVEFDYVIPDSAVLQSGVDFTVYLCAGANITTDLQSRTTVWDSNYSLVDHFGDGTTLDLTDSTANHNDGTNHGITAIAGIISQGTGLSTYFGGAGSFDGSSYAELPSSSASLNITGAITIENYQNISASITARKLTLFAHGNVDFDTFAGDGYMLADAPSLGSGGVSDCPNFRCFVGGTLQNTPGISSFSDGVGNIKWDGSAWDNISSARSLVDTYGPGVTLIRQPSGNQTWTTVPAIGSATGNRLGAQLDGNNKYQGTIDELRISNILRSDDWIWTSYLTTNFPGDFGPDFSTFPRDEWYYRLELVALAIECGSPPDGVVGTPYTHTFPASGGTPPYVFSIIAGALPDGLTITDTATGVVSGIPTLAGTFSFTIQVEDSTTATESVPCSITISDTPPPPPPPPNNCEPPIPPTGCTLAPSNPFTVTLLIHTEPQETT